MGRQTWKRSTASDSHYHPCIELLESRVLLSSTIFLVQNTNDSGAGSLRAAIQAANRRKGPATIEFAPSLSGSTIDLTSGQLLITRNLQITGPGANQLTISAGNLSRIFQIAGFARTTISGLTLRDGRANGDGGAIDNLGTCTIQQCLVTSNTAVGNGGGIVNFGKLTVSQSTFSNNTANDGGAIANLVSHRVVKRAPSLVVSHCTITANVATSPLHNTYYDYLGGGDDGETLNVGPRYGSGGGIFNDAWVGGNRGQVSVDFSTIIDNQANDGGGIYNVPFQGGPVTLSGTVVAENTVTGRGSDISGGSQATSCLIQNTDPNVNPHLDGYALVWGKNNLESVVPGLQPLDLYGGTTPTCPPVSDSPTINHGPSAANKAVDQVGNPRVSGGRTDIGAVEVLTADLQFWDGHPAKYVDSNSNTVTVTLSGPGMGDVYVPKGGGNAEQLVVTGTTDQSVLIVKVENSGSEQTTTIGSIVIHGSLKQLDAAANLAGDMQVDSSVGQLNLNDVKLQLPSLLKIGENAGTFSFHDVQGLNVQVGGRITSLSANSWQGLNTGRTSIQAASVGNIAIAGKFQGVMVDSANNIDSVIVGGSMTSVNLYAGVNPGSSPIPDPAVDFVTEATIGVITASTSASPVVAARHLGQIHLGPLSDATPSTFSGLVADDIAHLELVTPSGQKIDQDDLHRADQSEQFGQFQVTLDVVPDKLPWRFASEGDSRGTSHDNQLDTTIIGKIANAIQQENLDMVLFSGDLIDRGQFKNGPEGFQLWKDTVAGPQADTNHSPIYYLAMGNHEISNVTNPATNYLNAFPGQVFPLGAGVKTYLLINSPAQTRAYNDLSYYFIYKKMLFIQLDNYGPDYNERAQFGPIDGHVTARQTAALAALARKLDGKYTSAAMSGHVPATMLLRNSWTLAYRLFSNYVGMKGEYYFAGHVHAYRQVASVKPVAGLKEIVVGTAGAPQENKFKEKFGFLLVSVSNGRIVPNSLKYEEVS